MNNRLAFVLSVLFHPLILPTYLFALLFFIAPELIGTAAFEPRATGSLLLLIFLNTFIAPAVVIYYLKKAGFITSLQVEDVNERRLPYLACVVIYALATYLFGWRLEPISELAPKISIILGNVTIMLLLVLVISLFWKISAHATGIGGLITMLAGLIMLFNETVLLLPLLFTILIGGLVLSARLQLNAHTPLQILGGIVCGSFVSCLTVIYFF